MSVAGYARASTDTPLHCALQKGNDVFFSNLFDAPDTAVLDGNEFATPNGAVYKWSGATGDITSGGSCSANRNDVSMCTGMTIGGSPDAGDTMYTCLPCGACPAGQQGTVKARVRNARRVIYSHPRLSKTYQQLTDRAVPFQSAIRARPAT